jgi:hypothetical protein
MLSFEAPLESMEALLAALDKLLDCFINILAGGVGLVEINTRVRPDGALQRAFGRTTCAEQSTVSDTLNACTSENVVQLRRALTVTLLVYSRGKLLVN